MNIEERHSATSGDLFGDIMNVRYVEIIREAERQPIVFRFLFVSLLGLTFLAGDPSLVELLVQVFAAVVLAFHWYFERRDIAGELKRLEESLIRGATDAQRKRYIEWAHENWISFKARRRRSFEPIAWAFVVILWVASRF